MTSTFLNWSLILSTQSADIKVLQPQTLFEFSRINTEGVSTQLKKLKSKKSSPIDSIHSKVLQEHLNIFPPLLQNSFNLCIETHTFPETLKKGNISSILEKGDAFEKKNYRPISVLPSLFKIFERLIENQVKSYTNSFLSPLLWRYREGHSTQHALLRLVENCKKALHQKMNTGAVFIDISKELDALNHDLTRRIQVHQTGIKIHEKLSQGPKTTIQNE